MLCRAALRSVDLIGLPEMKHTTLVRDWTDSFSATIAELSRSQWIEKKETIGGSQIFQVEESGHWMSARHTA